MDRPETSESQGHRNTLAEWIGIALLIVGTVGGYLASKRQGADYASLQLVGVGITQGSPIYDLDWQKTAFPRLYDGLGAPLGMFYPPATGFAMLPFALLPYRLGQFVWFVLLVGSIVVGTRALLRLVVPGAAPHVWKIAAGVILLSASLRWGLTPLQGAPLVAGLLCLFVVALHRGHRGWALAIACYATAFKITMALPFLGLLFLHRRHLDWLCAVAVSVALNVVGFARLGGSATVALYRHNVAGVEGIDQINTPDPWRVVSVPRLDWTYLFYGSTGQLELSRIATMGATVAVGLWVLWEWQKVRGPFDLPTTTAFLGPLVCLSLLSVYHHHYDVSLLLAPLLVAAFGPERLRQPRWAVKLVWPLLVVMALVPVATLHRIFATHFGDWSVGIVNLTFPLVTTLTLVASCGVLHALVAKESVNAAVAPAAE